MRPFRLLAALALGAAAAGPAPAAAAAGSAGPATVIVTTSVGTTAAEVMPPKLWRKLVVDSVGPHASVTDDEPTIADDARCRAAHAAYAVFATFERAPRLPGMAQDPDRIYAIARLTVRSCFSGTPLSARIVGLESDPSATPGRGETQPNPARQWERAVHSALGHLTFAAPAASAVSAIHVLSVHRGLVTIERGGNFGLNQVLRATPAGGGPPRASYELVVTEVLGKVVQATLVGSGEPHPGDVVEAAPPK